MIEEWGAAGLKNSIHQQSHKKIGLANIDKKINKNINHSEVNRRRMKYDTTLLWMVMQKKTMNITTQCYERDLTKYKKKSNQKIVKGASKLNID